MSEAQKKIHGLLAEFENPAALLQAAKTMHTNGYTRFDCHSPFPVHGLVQAMGQRRSVLGFIIAGVAFFAMIGGLALQWWTNAVDYPFIISGKPFFSYQSYAPVGFGIAILISAIATVVFLSLLNKMPRLFHPLFFSERFRKVTDDGFFVSVEADDPKFEVAATSGLLESAGGKNIEILQDS